MSNHKSFIMKGSKCLLPTLMLILSICCPILLSAQNTKADKAAEKKAHIRDMVESQTYDFIAQTAIPTTGRTRQITPDYDLQVSKTAVVSYLPYYGRAYSAPMDPTQNVGQFTSKDFDYKIDPAKKGGWNIQIKPKDNREVQQLFLTIQESGYATLQVVYTNRQPMTFNGYIAAIKPKKSK